MLYFVEFVVQFTEFCTEKYWFKKDYKLQRTSYCSRPTPRNKAIEVVHLYNYLN